MPGKHLLAQSQPESLLLPLRVCTSCDFASFLTDVDHYPMLAGHIVLNHRFLGHFWNTMLNGDIVLFIVLILITYNDPISIINRKLIETFDYIFIKRHLSKIQTFRLNFC